jgi:LysM repeat protein
MTRFTSFFFRWTPLLVMAFLSTVSQIEAASERTYVVQKNDTLTRIAQHFRVTISDLQQANQLKHPDRIYIGQVLRIPSSRGARTIALDETLLQKLEAIKVQPGKWEHIVIHHTASATGTVKAIDRYHREERRMENGLAYHFLIGNGRGMGDGEIAIGRRWARQLDGGHMASLALNRRSIGICLVGDFEKEKPTPSQIHNLQQLVLYLLDRCQMPPESVSTHRQMHPRHTRCPGRNFPIKSFLAELKKAAS